MASPERERIAYRHGFGSYAELLDISTPLPVMDEDLTQSYVARNPKGYWFIWEEVIPTPKIVQDVWDG